MRLDCRTHEELSGFVKGRLASNIEVQVVEHIVQCRECRARAIALLNQEADGPERRRCERRQTERRQIQAIWNGPERRFFERRRGDRRQSALA